MFSAGWYREMATVTVRTLWLGYSPAKPGYIRYTIMDDTALIEYKLVDLYSGEPIDVDTAHNKVHDWLEGIKAKTDLCDTIKLESAEWDSQNPLEAAINLIAMVTAHQRFRGTSKFASGPETLQHFDRILGAGGRKTSEPKDELA